MYYDCTHTPSSCPWIVYTDHTAYKGPPVLAGGNRTGLIMASGNGLELMELVPKTDSSASARVKTARRTVSRPNASVANCRV